MTHSRIDGHQRSRRRVGLWMVCALALFASACGSDAGDPSSAPSDQPAPSSAPSDQPASPATASDAGQALVDFASTSGLEGDTAFSSLDDVVRLSDLIATGVLGEPQPGRAIGFGSEDPEVEFPSFTTTVFELSIDEQIHVSPEMSNAFDGSGTVWLEYYASRGDSPRVEASDAVAGARVAIAAEEYTVPNPANVRELEGYPVQDGDVVVFPGSLTFLVELGDGSVVHAQGGHEPVLIARALGVDKIGGMDSLVSDFSSAVDRLAEG